MIRKITCCLMLTTILLTICCASSEGVDGRQPVIVTVLDELTPDEVTEEASGAPFIPEDSEGRAVILQDDRVTVTNPAEYPYSAIAYIQAEATCGCRWSGTGFMISDRWMLTAGHCMYCITHLKPVQYVDFYFGYKNERNSRLHQSNGCSIWVSNYVKDGSYYTNDDYAYIRFEQAIGDQVGWFGYYYGAPDNKLENTTYYCAGYKDGIMKKDYDRTHVISDKKISHIIDTEPGYSGAPIFNNEYYVVAINTAHATDGSENYGVRFTYQLYKCLEDVGFPN